MTGLCNGTRTRFDGYLDESLSREERSAVREHLAECAACRREASELDPALLFATLPAERVSDADAARILDGVRAGIALKTAERRVRPAPRHGKRIGATAAAVAAAVLIAVTLSSPSPGRLELARGAALPAPAPSSALAAGPEGRSLPSNAAPSNAAAAAAGTSADSTAAGDPAAAAGAIAIGSPTATARPFSPFAEASAPGRQRQKVPADATIYDWNPGGGQPRVVWIVDRSLDI
ncbi:MAG: anti-sigma factor [Acidobacteriota bacterium]